MATITELARALGNARAAGADADAASLQKALRAQLSGAFYAAQAAHADPDARAIVGYVQQHGMTLLPMDAAQRNAAFQAANAQNAAGMSAQQKLLAGAGKSFVDDWRGAKQLLGLSSAADVRAADAADAALMHTGAGKLGDFAGTMAQLAIPIGGGGKLAALGGRAFERAAPYLLEAAKGAAFSGVQPVRAGETRLGNMAENAALSAGGVGVSRALGAAAHAAAPAVSAAKKAAIATAEKYGIPLHLSQVTDSRPLQTLASVTKYLPFAGNRAAADTQRQAFNRALASTIGQQASELTPGVLRRADTAKSAGYDALFGRTMVDLDAPAWQRLGQLRQAAQQDLPPADAQVVLNQIGKYVDAAGANEGSIPGRLYQSVRQSVQKVEGRGASKTHAQYLIGQVRKAMQDAATRSMGPEDAQTLRALNGVHSNSKILRKALTQAQGANYSISPANLWRLVNTRYGATPEMRELAQLGQTVLKDPIPDSGTTARNLYTGLLVGGGALAPHALPELAAGGVLGATAGRVMNSPWAARNLPNAGARFLQALSQGAVPLRYALPALVDSRRAANAAQVAGFPLHQEP